LRALILLFALLLTASTATGAGPVQAFVHGNDLYPGCQTSPDQGCYIYVVGVADALELTAQRWTNICRPKAVTNDQLLDVFMDWLEERPAERHRPAAKLAALAFAEAWPCKQ
jgi:hypothetical protein